LRPKAAWRFASRRSPKSMVAAQAALGSSVSIRGKIRFIRIILKHLIAKQLNLCQR
jgi:hypothetical protein